MLKVLIVDDEMLVRIGIQSLIPWKEHGFDIVGDAEDGKQALDMIEKMKPDIVLTDIVMPGLDGLELIESVKRKFPSIRICVLSSYSDYDYVRQAMKLGADDYFLKASMKPNELLKLLEDMKLKMSAQEAIGETTASPVQFETLLRGDIPDQLQSLMHNRPCNLLYFRTHRYSERSQGKAALHKSITRLLEQQFNESGCNVVFEHQDEGWIAIVPQDGVVESAKDFIVAANRFLNITMSIGYSGRIISSSQIEEAYTEAKQAWEDSFYEGKGKVLAFRKSLEAPFLSTDAAENTPVRLLQQLEQEGDKEMNIYVEQIFQLIRASRPPLARNIEVFLEIWHCMNRFLQRRGMEDEFAKQYPFGMPIYERIVQIETITEAEEFFRMLLDDYNEGIQKWKKESFSEDIRKLLDFIHEHYRERISLKDAAEHVNMSESYLSYLFKKETQRSVIEYVSELRMNEAAALLRDTDLPSYVIADKVGYHNINYFGRIFKRWQGVSPTHYRDRFRQ